jgi:hypothetical protein
MKKKTGGSYWVVPPYKAVCCADMLPMLLFRADKVIE